LFTSRWEGLGGVGSLKWVKFSSLIVATGIKIKINMKEMVVKGK